MTSAEQTMTNSAAAPQADGTLPNGVPPCPYVGPRSFRPGETLYGREFETAELCDLLVAERTVLLYSPSGAGKSSLINAALLPRLREQDFRPIPPVRVNQTPPDEVANLPDFNRYAFSVMLSLEENLPAEMRRSPQELAGMKLAQYMDCVTEELEISDSEVFIFDQFEEVLTIDPTNREAKIAFFTQLGQALRDKTRWTLFVIREDYLAALDPYLRYLPGRLGSRFRLNLLETEGAMQAIRQPALDAGVAFRDDAARELVDDLRSMKVQQMDGTMEEVKGLYVEPVQLQVVCRRLWSLLKAGEAEITLDHIQAMGSANQALSDYYAETVTDVAQQSGVTERAIRKWCDSRLITLQGIRGQVLLGATTSDGLPNSAVRQLEKAYLIRGEKRGGATWFELSHDRLIEPVRANNAAWFEAHLVPLQRQAEIWDAEGRPEGQLLIAGALDEAIAWARTHASGMTDVERDFLRVCEQARAVRRRDRLRNQIIQGLFVVSVIIGIFAIYQYYNAHKLYRESRSLMFASQAATNLSIDPAQSILLSLEAIKNSSNPQDAPWALEALHNSIQALRLEHTLSGHTDKVYAAIFSPDDRYVATASQDGTARIWDAASGKQLVVIQGPPEGFTDVSYSPDGTLLAIACKDGSVWLVDSATGSKRMTLTGHEREVWYVTFSPDGKQIASASSDGTARVWSAESGEQVMMLEHTAGLEVVEYSPDGKWIGTGSDNVLTLWDAGGKYVRTIETTHDRVLSVRFSPNGGYVATAGEDRTVSIWDLSNDSVVQQIEGHLDWVYRASFAPGGYFMATASSDRTVKIWDLPRSKELFRLVGHTDQVFDVGFDSTGRHLVTASEDTTARIWTVELAGNHEAFTYEYTYADSYGSLYMGRVYDVTYSPDGKYVTAVGYPGFLHAWDVASGEIVQTMQVPGQSEDKTESVAYAPDGSLAAFAGRSGKMVLFDPVSGTMRKIIQVGEDGTVIWNLDFSRDGKQLATASADGIIRVWDTASGQEQKQLTISPLPNDRMPMVMTLDWNPNMDGLLLAGYTDGRVVLWDVDKAQILQEQKEHGDSVQGVRFSPQNDRVASAGDDGLVILWKYDAKQQQLTPSKKLGNHTGSLFALAFDPTGKTLATAGADLTIRVWDVKTESELYTIKSHTDRIYGLAFAPDGKQLVSVSGDGTVRGYAMDVNELIRLAKERLACCLSEQAYQELMQQEGNP